MNCHDMSQCRVRLEEGKSYFASQRGWHFKLVMGILEGQKDPRKGSLTLPRLGRGAFNCCVTGMAQWCSPLPLPVSLNEMVMVKETVWDSAVREREREMNVKKHTCTWFHTFYSWTCIFLNTHTIRLCVSNVHICCTPHHFSLHMDAHTHMHTHTIYIYTHIFKTIPQKNNDNSIVFK